MRAARATGLVDEIDVLAWLTADVLGRPLLHADDTLMMEAAAREVAAREAAAAEEAHRPLPAPWPCVTACVEKCFLSAFQNGMIEARAARYNLQAVAEAHARALGQRLLELVEVEGAVAWLGL